MRATILLRISCADAATAGKLETVLKPDNRKVPKGQSFSMLRKSGAVLFEIRSSQFQSALSSAQSVLSDASLFQEIWLLSRDAGA